MNEKIKAKKENDFITVIPYHTDPACLPGERIQVRKLCFWRDGIYNHLVNEDSLINFLRKAELLGATVFPNAHLSCCFIMESEAIPYDGELPISQIIYKNEIIYTMDETKIKVLMEVLNKRL